MSGAELVRGVATYGLPGVADRLPDAPLDDATWSSLLRTVDQQRLAGFLQAAVQDGAFPVTEEQAVELEGLHLRWCSTVLQLERRLLQLTGALEAEGLQVIALKGSAVAHLAYPDPSLRSFGDVDLLFRAEDFDRAVELLCARGYVRQTAQARPGFERRFGKGTTLEGPDGDELDLHCNLVFGSFGFRIDRQELFRSSVRFDLGGARLTALGPETRLLHACYHAALGDPRPRYSSIRDVAQMLLTGDHDPDRVLELARRWEAEAVVARAVRLCREHLGAEVDSLVAEGVADHRVTRRERRAIDSYVGENQGFAAKVVATLPYLDGARDRVAFLGAVLAPQPEFVVSHGGRPGWAWIRRGFRSLFRGSHA